MTGQNLSGKLLQLFIIRFFLIHIGILRAGFWIRREFSATGDTGVYGVKMPFADTNPSDITANNLNIYCLWELIDKSWSMSHVVL